MSRCRRLGVLLLGLAAFSLVAFWQDEFSSPVARAQVGPPTPASEAFTVPSEWNTKRRLDTAKDFIKTESWPEAVRILQAILDAKEDAFLPAEKHADAQTIHWLSARTEGARLLGKLPVKGYTVYESLYGETAAGLLADARQANDLGAVDNLVRRYFHTRAGFDAMLQLARHHLDRGRFAAAAGCFERLLDHREAPRLSLLDLFHAAVAFHVTGETDKEERVWKLLSTRAGSEGIGFGNETLSVADARKEVEGLPRDGVLSGGWPLYRGDPARTGSAPGGTPFLEARWRARTLTNSLASTWARTAIADLQNRGQPVLPAFFPITAGDKLVYRTYRGIEALDLKTGEAAWKKPVVLSQSLETLLEHFGHKVQLEKWWRLYGNDWNVVFENATIGSLSSDRRLVFAIDDIPFTPHPSQSMEIDMGMGLVRTGGAFGPFDDPYDGTLYFNQLKAYDLATGNLVWTVGGRGHAKDPKVPPLHDHLFLGPPLPLAGKLYVVAEQNQDEKHRELRLLCLDSGTGELLWFQTLGAASDKPEQDPGRRIHGAHLAYADGVLICPTNCGAIVAVDPFTRNLLWAHLYRDHEHPPVIDPNTGLPGYPPGFLTGSWKPSAPLIHDGKVLFTAADADTLQCLNLRDGKLLWKINRLDDDRYLAAAQNGKVLVVGRTTCRALKLADGSDAWTQATGTPSGQGVLSGSRYYLPLKSGAVCVLDMNTGVHPTYLASRTKEVPGNLLFSEGDLVSQGVDSISVYPQLEVKLARLEELLKKNPDDPVALTERGQFRLDQGDLTNAVADLQRALHHNPPPDLWPKTRDKLYEGLTQLLQRDFAAAEKYLAEYEALCRLEVPAGASADKVTQLRNEERRRQIVYRSLVARGREQQGRLLDALQAYEDLYAAAGNDNHLLALDPSPVDSRPGNWAVGRVAELLARTSGEPRVLLDKHIGQLWQSLRVGSDAEALSRFVALYGIPTAPGRLATLRLAENSLSSTDPQNWLEAERRLLPLCRPEEGGPQLTACAIEVLARILARKGLLEDAAACYRRLGTEFPKVMVRDGKTGADFRDEMALDKRFLPYFNPPPPAWANRKFQVAEVAGTFPPRLVIELEPEVDPRDRLPLLFHQFQLWIDLTEFPSRIHVTERASGTERWNVPVNLGIARQFYQQLGQSQRLTCQVKGHVLVVNLGMMICALDLTERRLLWQRDVPALAGTPEPRYSADGSFQLAWPDGWTTSLGLSGPARSPCAFLQTRQGLLAIDAVSGNLLWKRTDLTTVVEMFGDEQCLYMVESRGDGTFGGSRAVRVLDGANVQVNEFAQLYAPPKRIGIVGRLLLLSETSPEDDRVTLRAYDVQAGEDSWKRVFPKGTLVLQSQEPTLAGVVEPNGKVTVVDVAADKVVLDAQLEKEHLDKVDAVFLFRDALHVYVGLKAPPSGKDGVQGDPYPNLAASLRTVALNGELYAFDRTTGKLHWRHMVAHQVALLEKTEDLPVLLFASIINRTWNGGAGIQVQEMVTRSLDKRTGKVIYEKRVVNNNQGGYHTVSVDPRTGTIELVSAAGKIRHTPAK